MSQQSFTASSIFSSRIPGRKIWQQGEPLCYQCDQIDFDDVFKSPGHCYSHVIRSIDRIIESQHDCAFCRITLDAIPHLSSYKDHGRNWVITRGDYSGYLQWDKLDLPQELRYALDFPMSTMGFELLDVPEQPSSYLSSKVPYRVQLLSEGSSHRRGRQKNSMYLRHPESVGFHPDFTLEDQKILNTVPVDIFSARSIDQYVQITLINNWLNHCSDLHVHTCKPKPMEPIMRLSFHLRLIDVEQWCIVDAPLETDVQYVCLSYVWGNVSHNPRLNIANKADLFAPDGLNRFYLPYTICDAITLCHRLRFRYLWVDALCIIQDDLEDLHAHIKHMDTIYKCAILTIVAAAGADANSGLPGVDKVQRYCKETTAFVKGYELTTVPHFPTFAIEESAWHSRAWTYQEQMLSHRMIGFLPGQAYFQCQGTTWSLPVHEATINSGDYHRHVYEPMKQTLNKTKPFSIARNTIDDHFAYTDMVESYTGRTLSYDSDIINAFEGLMACFEGQIDGVHTDWYYGMPTAMFGWALCWENGTPNPPKPGNVVWNATPGPVLRRQGFPSWSWTGWKTRVCMSALASPDVHAMYSQQFMSIKEHRGSGMLEERAMDRLLCEKHGLHIAPHGVPEEALNLNTGVLTFTTSFAKLWVTRELEIAEESAAPMQLRYKLLLPDDHDVGLGTIALTKEWREQAPDMLDFIVIHVIDQQRGVRRRRNRDRELIANRVPDSDEKTCAIDEPGHVADDSFEKISEGSEHGTEDIIGNKICSIDSDNNDNRLDAAIARHVLHPAEEVNALNVDLSESFESYSRAPDVTQLKHDNDPAADLSSRQPSARPSFDMGKMYVHRDRKGSDADKDKPLYHPSGLEIEYVDSDEDAEGDDNISDFQIYLMCVDWIGDLAYRVQMAGGERSDEDWMKANPIERVVRLA